MSFEINIGQWFEVTLGYRSDNQSVVLELRHASTAVGTR
jgi:hypothetical protein